MDPTPEFIAHIDREKIRRARRMSPEEKLAAGPRLFSLALACMRTGILLQIPDADEATIKSLIHQRLERLRRKDKQPFRGTP